MIAVPVSSNFSNSSKSLGLSTLSGPERVSTSVKYVRKLSARISSSGVNTGRAGEVLRFAVPLVRMNWVWT
jgi:hypothetical protein